MEKYEQAGSIVEFVASAHVFTTAIDEVVEEQLLKEAGGGEVTISQLKLLKLVSVREAQTIGNVAAFLGVSNAAASKAVDRLVRRGLLLRSESEKDRRVIHLSLTESGSDILTVYDDARQRKLIEIFGGISAEDFHAAAALLDRLSARIVEYTAESEEICLQCGIYFREECLMRKMLGRRCIYQQNVGTDGSTVQLSADDPGSI